MPCIPLPKRILITGLSTLLLACNSPIPWQATQLTLASQNTPACLTELHLAINTILADELTGITIHKSVLETLIQSGSVDQHVNLYGGQQIRHWTFANFDNQKDCAIYNHATTRIDLRTNAKTTQSRPLRNPSNANQNVQRPLPHCICTAPLNHNDPIPIP